MSGYRLEHGGDIDRSRPVTFRWEGRTHSGFAGDTLASALLASGERMVGRSFKYHRPRGLIAAGLDEPNAIVQLEQGAGTIPNLKAPYVELYEGLDANPVNAWPSLRFDLMAVNGLFKRFIPAAFYYKTFMWPDWLLFEPAIRKAAGLGKAPDLPDPDTYAQVSVHMDVLVVGGGIAGLAAALHAAQAGKSVMLVTGSAHWGGRLAGTSDAIEGKPARVWIEDTLRALAALPNVTLKTRTLATGHYDHGMVALCERLTDHLPLGQRTGPRQRLWRVRANELVLAQGAIERPLVFRGNDRPGVILAGAARAYLHRYGVVAGREIVVATNNDSAWQAAFDLAEAGTRIAAIADARGTPSAALTARADALGIPVHAGMAPSAAIGGRIIRGVRLGRVNAAGRIEGQTIELCCDTLLVSGGWNPAVHLHSHGAGRLTLDPNLQSFVPLAAAGHRSIGGAAGDFTPDGTLAAARGDDAPRKAASPIPALWSISETGEPDPEAWVDFQNDVTAGDVALAARENFRSVEHLKRYTTLGMASDQGKTSNVNGIGILGTLLDKPMEAIGTTKFRPPYDPTPFGVFAGHRVGEGLHPRRRLALHDWHVERGALLDEYGGWMRPAAYLRPGEQEADAVRREVLAVRSGVGLFEASPLGKIKVKGPDAAAFLDRMYVNTISTLKVGRCRYAIMLTENGTVFDDGVVTRLADDRFLVGTTSGHAAAVAEAFREWLQCEWTQMRVLVEDVTTCRAVANIAGPKARHVLAALEPDIDISGDAFPHMSARAGRICGIPTQVARVSFTGELSYEIAVPWRDAERLWTALVEAGAPHGLTPFGVEALMTMRIEKGFLHVGSDTDGTTLPQDIGFGGIMRKKTQDFVGRRSALRPDGLRGDRRSLVGLEVTDGNPAPLVAGAHVLPEMAAAPKPSEGWVTSSAWSPTLEAPLALALVARGQDRIGESVRVWDLGAWREARITGLCRYDPEGARLDA
ncbi:sarcosine oxidase subunit alpha family protein [Sphingosinicella microcystinivorans]|uniref:sarcosine oxidase subunit alpha family protein n=1 Tax=Sphingosinicella microcystinivorans TaxID=335406 RepID=UPI0022F3A806|nr:sarcosine oxidase subunit alpha family protein [Sphingosinicella microcystinivorans]WBX82350.1 sarcosine oxidase subunit alpha family protein [Sphingosinicella microcystinivorans]